MLTNKGKLYVLLSLAKVKRGKIPRCFFVYFTNKSIEILKFGNEMNKMYILYI